MLNTIEAIQDEWVKAETAITRKGLFNIIPAPRLEEVVCATCQNELT